MAKRTSNEQKARALCRHTVCFADAQSRLIAARALQGLTTKAIAHEMKITESQVSYAIIKAQRSLGITVRFRRDYRNGSSPLARKIMSQTVEMALGEVSRRIAPKFAKFAADGIPRN